MRRLASFPRMGHLRADITDEPYRFWSVYLPDTKPLEIVRVMHGARDLGKFFKKK